MLSLLGWRASDRVKQFYHISIWCKLKFLIKPIVVLINSTYKKNDSPVVLLYQHSQTLISIYNLKIRTIEKAKLSVWDFLFMVFNARIFSWEIGARIFSWEIGVICLVFWTDRKTKNSLFFLKKEKSSYSCKSSCNLTLVSKALKYLQY